MISDFKFILIWIVDTYLLLIQDLTIFTWNICVYFMVLRNIYSVNVFVSYVYLIINL